ncbi:MAG: hypothetical protein HDP34_02350 [Clostridia bacterium]|nr:hypothetical protein [Clostridia bacterium]
MNRVLENEKKERNIQIYRSSKKMFTEAKISKIFLYLVNFIPLILIFTQGFFITDEATANLVKFTSSAVSIILNVLTELISNIVANHKEKAVLLAQLFETEITGTTLTKMEYDRELTNELFEIAIRKGTLKKEKKYTGAYDVPQEISDKYAFMFINRYIAAENRFLLDKLQIVYGILITAISIGFVFWLSNMSMTEALYYIVCFWSVFIPIVRNFAKCAKNKRQCVKISADIDNYLADGDDSKEKLQRFNSYIQSISFEMRNNLVSLPNTLRWLLSYQIKVLDVGVTNRFIEAVYQFENLVLEKKGIKTSKKKFEWISRETKTTPQAEKREKEIIQKAQKATPSAKVATPKPAATSTEKKKTTTAKKTTTTKKTTKK